MATLDRVIEMQNQGYSDTDISTQLQNEGISPMEINNSINQARVKSAISPPADDYGTPSIATPAPEQYPPQQQMPQAPAPMPPTPAPEQYPQEVQLAPAQAEQEYYQDTPQAYSGQEYYMPTGAPNTETISEIAEQVVTSKLTELTKIIKDLARAKTAMQDKVSDLDDRLKRIEGSIDKLQQSVVGKIGEFGESSAMIHKDLNNLHGTVSKLMDPLIDNLNALKKK